MMDLTDPGTGAHDDVTNMVINAALTPLWKPDPHKIASPKIAAARTRKKSPKVVAAKNLPLVEGPLDGGGSDGKSGTPVATPVHNGAGAPGGPRGRGGFKAEIRRVRNKHSHHNMIHADMNIDL